MRWLTLAVLLILTPVHAAASDLDQVLAKGMEGKAVPATAVMILRDYKVDAVAVRGGRRMDQPTPVSAADRWHLGSNGKAMTATMIARLVEQGVLSWDRPLAQMLPELASSMRPEYRDVTLQDLLSHRAGLGDILDDTDPFFQSFYRDRSSPTEQRRRWAVELLSRPPAAPKRGKNVYSNTGYIVAAYAAERATGKDYERLMQEEVFGPLGISSATTGFPEAGEAFGHLKGAPATPANANPPVFNPAGGWRMTLQDWGIFCLEHLEGARGRGKLLKVDTYRMLHTAQGETRAALGWGASPQSLGRQGPALTHSGSDGTWYALVVLFPKTGAGVLTVANAAEDMGGDKATSEIIRAAAAVANVAPPLAP